MAGLSTYASEALLNWFRGTTMPAAPGGVYVALYNGDPGNAGSGGSDVTATIRAAGRVAATFAAPSNKRIENDAAVEFGNSEGAATVTHFGLWDAASGGNFLGGRQLASTQSIAQGNPVAFLTGELAIDISPK